MVKKFEPYKIAIAVVWLVGALAFLLNQLATGAPTSAPGINGNDLSIGKEVKEIEGYRNWAKVNSVPQLMPKRVAADCVMWQTRAGIIVNGDSNPHRDKYFTVYVNDVGQKAMLGQKNPSFPEGSVIVKEKLAAKDSQTPELLTVMIKQKKGFNPASGDWEYMVLDGTGTKVAGRGKLQNCQACHLANQKTDYVFRTYLPRASINKLE